MRYDKYQRPVPPFFEEFYDENFIFQATTSQTRGVTSLPDILVAEREVKIKDIDDTLDINELRRKARILLRLYSAEYEAREKLEKERINCKAMLMELYINHTEDFEEYKNAVQNLCRRYTEITKALAQLNGTNR